MEDSSTNSVKLERNSAEEGSDDDTRCGIGRWKPDFLQRFANPKAYLIIFCILGLLQGAYFAYFIGVLSTLEKRYSFKSKVSGVILIVDSITPIFISTSVGYYGSRANRPRWIAIGMFFVVIGYLLSALPYFMYGPTEIVISHTDLKENKTEMCEFEQKEYCSSESVSITTPAVTCFIIASFLRGFGCTGYYTLGTAYLDDNVPKKQSALYLGVSFTVKLVGPILGFLLSSLCLNYYEDPSYDPGYSKEDPRWIGAWWIGFLALGFTLMIFLFPMLLFPRVLPSKKVTSAIKLQDEKHRPTFKDMMLALKRTAKNPVTFWFLASCTLVGNGMGGHYTFLPKYLETQYQKSASDANLYAGPTALISTQIGIMIGGIVIRRFKPKAHYIAGFITCADILTLILYFVFMTLGCPQMTMKGTELKHDELLLYNDCNHQCGCTTRIFEPVCGTEGQSTYFSPCFAGCTEYNETNFGNCSCVHGENGNFILSSVTKKYCPSDCNMLIPYIVLLGTMRTVASLTAVGSSLLLLRSTDPKDKTLTIGFAETVYSLAVFIPFPLIFGAATDAACLVWEKKCGTTGNCWIYDAAKFKYYLHGVCGGFVLLGIFCDCALTYYSRNLKNFYEDEVPNETEENKKGGVVSRESFSKLSLTRACSVK